MKPVNETLIEYLANPNPIVEVETIVTPIMSSEEKELARKAELDVEMKLLMAEIKKIAMTAKNLHYRAKGKPFYGVHELADLVWQTGLITDQIAEIYFMGERKIEPPIMEEVYLKACSLPDKEVITQDNYFEAVLFACSTVVAHVERIKKEYTFISGVMPVLDHISEQCLLAIGFLSQSLKH